MRRGEPIDAYLMTDAQGLRPQAIRLAYAGNPISWCSINTNQN
jgi:hypothetical protein